MKKSELKALIREVIEQVQNEQALSTQLSQMMKALQNNPKAANAIAAKLADEGAPIEPSELNEGKSGFLKKLAMLALAAGLSAGAVSTAKADAVTNVIRWGDEQIENFEQMNKDQMEKLGMKPSQAAEGSVRDLYNKHKKQGVFKKYREAYLAALDDKDPSKAVEESERIEKKSIQHAWNLVKMGSDYNEYNKKGYIPSVVAGITYQSVEKVKEIMQSDTLYKDVVIK